MRAKHRFHPIVIVAIAFIAAIVIFAIAGSIYRILTWPGIFPKVEPRPFDSAQWKAWTFEDSLHSPDVRKALLRRDMLDDLVAAHTFVGMTAEELKNLLGEPDQKFLPIESDWGKWDLAYPIGAVSADVDVLVFRLDEKGRVVSFKMADW